MISTNLTGNLGNHMWQYAVCRIVAEKLGYEWGINSSPTHDYHQGMNQMYFINVDFGQKIEGEFSEFHEKWINHKHVDDVNITMYDSRVFDIKDNTILIGDKGAKGGIYQSEDYLIERKQEIIKWFEINEKYKKEYEDKLKSLNIILDEDLCVINFRGGEYRTLKNVILRKEYWSDSINKMLKKNPNMKFVLISDDKDCARHFMPFEIPAFHFDIGFDFYAVNNAKNLILSNSTFGWWAAWLNTKAEDIIAPKYWARHNVSDGYWATGDSYTRCFKYLDREGNIFDYNQCKKEAESFYKERGIV